MDKVKEKKRPGTAVVSSMGQFNARFIQLIAMTVTSTFQHFGNSTSDHHLNLAYQLTEEIELIDVIENLSLIPLKRIQIRTVKNIRHSTIVFDHKVRRRRT